MSDPASLRRPALALALHAAVLFAIAAFGIPWKTPPANVAILLFAALEALAAVGLARDARWGHRLGLIVSGLGLAAGVVVVAGLLSSWAFLRGTWGEFGGGAAIGALLLAAVAFELTGLFPAWLLSRLLRAEVRARFGPGRAPGAGVVVVTALLPLAAAWLASEALALRPLAPLSPAQRGELFALLDAARAGRPLPATPALRGVPVDGPLHVTALKAGRSVARVAGRGEDLQSCASSAAAALARQRRKLADARLKVDRTVASGRVPEALLAAGIAHGTDGLTRDGLEDEKALLPDDLLRAGLFGRTPVLPMLRELRFGADAGWLLRRLPGPGALRRFRTEALVEHEGALLPVTRGGTAGPAPDAQSFRQAALEGGAFVLRRLRADGRFDYRYDPVSGRASGDGDYSLARHAGAAYSLAQLYGGTGEERWQEGARRALDWLVQTSRADCPRPGLRCFPNGDWAPLGPAALSAIAMLEYQRRTGDPRFAAPAGELLASLEALQLPSGELQHRARLSDGAPDERFRTMFASEQAALAFVLADTVLARPQARDRARRALDWLVDDKYDFFLGGFLYGADHWSCLAALDAHETIPDRRYLDFCLGYSRFLQRLQFQPGGWENADYAGHYGFSAVLVPQAPGTAGLTEAIAATTALAQLHGLAAPDVERQAFDGCAALLRDQLRDENAFLARDPAEARGGVRRSLVEPEIRLDFTQHALSALLACSTHAATRPPE